jgi:transposase
MSMRKIREVLRLTHELGLSVRQVREATGVGKTAVSEYVSRAKVVGITWPIPPEITDADLERRLFAPAGFHDGSTKPVPDWTTVHQELKRRGVTLMILWEEHRAEHVEGHGYSRFCELYSEWRRRLAPTMRQTHVAGDKLFVDWAGDTVPIIDAMTGEVHDAHLFVAALGASSYTYAEARWSETLPDWIGAHVNAFDFLGGVPRAAVPDNLKAGITKPSRYEPGVNRTYQDLADHYGGHYYSVPFGLLRETVDARFTDGTIEVFHKGTRVASHVRSRLAHKHTTIPEHMPSSHRRYAEWTPARLVREAEKIGPATIALFEAIMKAKPHPEQGFRSCLGILSLVRSYGPERIEAAARRGHDIRATTYGSIKSILQNGLDRAFAKPNMPDTSPIRHANIRGRGYYH